MLNQGCFQFVNEEIKNDIIFEIKSLFELASQIGSNLYVIKLKKVATS